MILIRLPLKTRKHQTVVLSYYGTPRQCASTTQREIKPTTIEYSSELLTFRPMSWHPVVYSLSLSQFAILRDHHPLPLEIFVWGSISLNTADHGIFTGTPGNYLSKLVTSKHCYCYHRILWRLLELELNNGINLVRLLLKTMKPTYLGVLPLMEDHRPLSSIPYRTRKHWIASFSKYRNPHQCTLTTCKFNLLHWKIYIYYKIDSNLRLEVNNFTVWIYFHMIE